MLIECRAKRKRLDIRIGRKDTDLGTKVNLFDKLYWFRPQAELLKKTLGDSDAEYVDLEAHVCVVEDQRAIDRFLELAEQFNEYGKPPKIAAEPPPAEGQPEVITELEGGEPLGKPDQVKIDHLSAAREIQRKWVNDMLAKPVTVFVKDISDLDDDELELLLASERSDKRRKGVTDALKKAMAPTVVIPPDGGEANSHISME